MKKYSLHLSLTVLAFFVFVSSVFAQSADQNYIKTIKLLEAVDISTLESSYNSVQKIESVTYFDGFGKAKQSVAVKQSATKKDIVQHIEYDQFGRTSKQYLALPTSQNNGNYISNAQSQITTYYQNEFADQHPFSEVRYDSSPLNRRIESSSPGDTWQLLSNSDNDHTTKYEYSVNTTDEVYRIEIDETSITNPLSISHYAPEELLKNSIKNENWSSGDGLLNTKEVFNDKNGRKIAEIVYENNGGTIKKLATYYVYDDIGNLRYVLPPKLVDYFSNNSNYNNYATSWPINDFLEQGDAGANNINFSITDNVLLLKAKERSATATFPTKVLKTQTTKLLNTSPQLPDMYLGEVTGSFGFTDIEGNPVYIPIGDASIVNGNLVINREVSQPFIKLYILISVNLNAVINVTQTDLDNLAFQYKYDQFNRQIEQKVPGKDWEYMVYDQLDRPILTQDANLRAQNKWLFNKYDVFGRVVYSGKYTNSASRVALQTQVNNFINASANKANIVSRTTTTSNIGGVAINYSNNAFPNTNQETLTVSYFDDYNFTDSNLPVIPSHVLGQGVTNRTKGLLTSIWTKTLGSSTWSKNYTFYDKKGRVIYAHDKNYLGGHTQNKSKLDFRGKIEHSVTKHKRVSSSADLTITDRFEYDHVERPKKHYQQINGQEEELIAQNTYNELGQLQKKNIGGELGSSISDRYTDLVKLEATGSTIAKTHNSSSWNAGLATKGQITSDGFVEYEIPQTNKAIMVGLSTDNSSANYNTIDYALYTNHVSKVYIYESGVNKGQHGTYSAGDVMKVERIGTTVYYKKNGTTFYTSTIASSGKLIGDISMYHNQGAIKNLKISSGYTDITNLTASSITDNTQQIKKESGGTGWNAGLATIDAIKANGNGYIRYKISQTNKYMMIGLSDINTNAHYNTIDYAIYNHNGNVYVRENGANKGLFTSYQAHDEFSVERIGTTIFYKKNGDTFYTSLVSSSSRLVGDMSFYHVGGAISGLEIQNTESGLQTIDYIYNIRGWLTNINDVNNLGSDLFAYNLKYDEAIEGSASVSNIYNGNIKQAIWRSAQNNIKKSYAFEYDKLNRFSSSHYRENNSLTGGSGKFETNTLEYDANGNIKGLKRYNQTGNIIDKLIYSYDNGNKLLHIEDLTNSSNGFNEGSNFGNDYNYDANGNLIKDLNKNITNIEYNHLDLVERVTFGNGNKIEFTYNANGSKLQMKNILAGGSTTTFDYLGGFQYTNAQLQFFPTAEGYAAADGGTFKYVYIFTDHLGNNRLSFSDGNNDGVVNPLNEILSNTDHYAMGLTHPGEFIAGLASNFNYKYQSKEQMAFAGYNMYDFGSRMYDPAIGRWFNVDPQTQFWSPYVAMGNNWFNGIDPNGEFFLEALSIVYGLYSGISAAINGAHWGEAVFTAFWTAAITYTAGKISQGVTNNLAPSITNPSVAQGFASSFIGDLSGSIFTGAANGFRKDGDLIGGALSSFNFSNLASATYSGASSANFYSKKIKKADAELIAAGYNPKKPVDATQQGLNDFSNDVSELKRLKTEGGVIDLQIAATTNIPVGYSLSRRGVLTSPDKDIVGGITTRTGGSVRGNNPVTGSSIRIAPSRFKKARRLFFTVGHELAHASYNMKHALNTLKALNLSYRNNPSLGGGTAGLNESLKSINEVYAWSWSLHWGAPNAATRLKFYTNKVSPSKKGLIKKYY